MSDEPAFNVFAFNKAEEDFDRDLRRTGIPVWNIGKALDWALDKGFDTVLIERDDRPAMSGEHATHHVCTDPTCPGGCE